VATSCEHQGGRVRSRLTDCRRGVAAKIMSSFITDIFSYVTGATRLCLKWDTELLWWFCSADKPAAITAHMARENHTSGNGIIWPFYLIINLTIFDESTKLIGIFNNGDRMSEAFY